MIARCLSLALVVAIAGCAAEPDPPDVAYRKLTMSAIRAHLGSIGMLVGGRVERAGDLARHSGALAQLANSAPGLFPEGSVGGSSEAKPDIWQQPAEFQEALTMLQESTRNLATVATAGGSDVKAAFDDVRGACRNCHKQFRE